MDCFLYDTCLYHRDLAVLEMQRQAPVFLLHKCIGDWIFSFICKSKQNKHMDYDNGVSCNYIN